jgi:hypothetical protein
MVSVSVASSAGGTTVLVVVLAPNKGIAGEVSDADDRPRNSVLGAPNGDGAAGVVNVGVGKVMFAFDPNEKEGIEPELPGAFMLVRKVLPPPVSPLLVAKEIEAVLVLSPPLLLLANELLANEEADAETPNTGVV